MAEGKLTLEPVNPPRANSARAEIGLGCLKLDAKNRQATVAGTVLELTKIEYKLLHMFVSNPGTALSREALFQEVWGYDMQFNTNSLEVMVYRLRSKLAESNARLLIRTVRNHGYIAEADEAP